MNFSVVIPTYNRPADLNRCLDSIFNQPLRPAEIIIIDDGDLGADYINRAKKKFAGKDIPVVYYKKNHELERRGLSESKNKALELVNSEIFFLFDDDVMLKDNFFAPVMDIWQSNRDSNLIGVGGIIANNRSKNILEKIYNHIFGLTSKLSWDITPAGFQVWDDKIKKAARGYYAHGGATSYKKSLAKNLRFTVFRGGRTSLEDVDFCWRAKKLGYYFILEPRARLEHHHRFTPGEDKAQAGFKEGANRLAIFEANGTPSFRQELWFWWSNLGWILRQLLTGQIKKGRGMIKGLLAQLTNPADAGR